MSTEHDSMTFTELVEGLEIPCDFSDTKTCPDDPAAWVLHRIVCVCGSSGARLSCTPCKDYRPFTDEAAVVCYMCGEVYAPARKAYTSCEPLERRER